MPEDWRGRYFQSGIGEMYVRETRITTKGSCIEQRQDYFLFYSRWVGLEQYQTITRVTISRFKYS